MRVFSRQSSVISPKSSVSSRQSSVFSLKSSVFSLKSSVIRRESSVETGRPTTDDSRLKTDDRRLTTMVAGAVVVLLLLAPSAGAALTEAARLAAVYDTILAAKFDEVEAQLKDACPPAPEEACESLAVVSLWWQIQLNPESHLLDGRFTELAQKSIAASEAWTRREPRRGEAWFYLAGSYAPLVQWRVAPRRARCRCARGKQDPRSARTRAGARPFAERCVLRHRAVSLLCGRGASSSPLSSMDAVPSRRRPCEGAPGDADGERTEESCYVAKPTTSCI